jgi:hypothetical protein
MALKITGWPAVLDIVVIALLLAGAGQAATAGANACDSACTLMDRLSCTPLSAISGLMALK